MFEAIAKFYTDGGLWMHPISFCSVVGIAVAVERIVALFFRYNINANHFMAQIQKLVVTNNVERAIKLCNAAPNAALPRVVKAGLTRANRGEEEIYNAIEEATLEVMPEVHKRSSLLPNVANIATLLGLLGTIIGLIEAFAVVAAAPPDMKSQMLTQALSIALNTTAWGLMVAIPLLAMYVFLEGAAKKINEECDRYSVKLLNLLVARGRSPSGATPEGEAGAAS